MYSRWGRSKIVRSHIFLTIAAQTRHQASLAGSLQGTVATRGACCGAALTTARLRKCVDSACVARCAGIRSFGIRLSLKRGAWRAGCPRGEPPRARVSCVVLSPAFGMARLGQQCCSVLQLRDQYFVFGVALREVPCPREPARLAEVSCALYISKRLAPAFQRRLPPALQQFPCV